MTIDNDAYAAIPRLKQERRAIVLAHYYQVMDVQNCADVVGDSFELARRAARADAETIVLCGVRFMAESAKILAPDKRVLLPVPDAGCPMADMVTPEDVRALRAAHPNAAVMCYVNTSAAVKAECDICCTSSSATRIARAVPQDEIIFLPDQNLGAYTARQIPEKKFILFDGYCPVHHFVTVDEVRAAKQARPDAPVLVHPECTPEVLALADFIGSTAQILAYVEKSSGSEFLIGTERGVCERIAQTMPGKRPYLISNRLVCPNMRKTSLSDVLYALENGVYEITLEKGLMDAARRSLEAMIGA